MARNARNLRSYPVAAQADDGETDTAPKRRGRPPGSGSGRKSPVNGDGETSRKLMCTLSIEAAIRLDEWMDAQIVRPTNQAVMEKALMEFLERYGT